MVNRPEGHKGGACSAALFQVCVSCCKRGEGGCCILWGALCSLPGFGVLLQLSAPLVPCPSPSASCSLCPGYCSFILAVGFLLAAHAWHAAVACWCCPVLPPGVLAAVKALLDAKERTNSCQYIDHVVKYFMLLWQLKF